MKKTVQKIEGFTFLKNAKPVLKSKNTGFTLVELLVVIAIVAILAAVVVLIIDPVELQRRGRDSARLADLSNLNNAISTAVSEATSSPEAVLCNGAGYPCSGSSYPLQANTRNNDGTGWIKVNLGAGAIKVPTLHVDPTNDSTYHFAYCADNDAWELNAVMESKKEKPRMANDGGDQNATDDTGRYEIGSNFTLINSSGTPCAY